MILKKILKGYATIGASVLRLAVLLAVCLAAAVVIVFPLWKLADSRPNAYTAVCLVLCAVLAVALSASRIRQSFLRNPRRFLLSLARKAVVAAGLVLAVVLVLQYKRLLAAGALVLTLLAYGYLAFGLAREDDGNR